MRSSSSGARKARRSSSKLIRANYAPPGHRPAEHKHTYGIPRVQQKLRAGDACVFMLKPEIALGWYFDMPTETEHDLAKIRTKYMPDVSGGNGGEE